MILIMNLYDLHKSESVSLCFLQLRGGKDLLYQLSDQVRFLLNLSDCCEKFFQISF